jgi:hypothetical protein
MTVGAFNPTYEKVKKNPAYPNGGQFQIGRMWEKVIY